MEEAIAAAAAQAHTSSPPSTRPPSTLPPAAHTASAAAPPGEKTADGANSQQKAAAKKAESDSFVDAHCPECKLVMSDPTPQELSLFLHALTYEGEDWKYETAPPYWAADDFADE